MSPNSEYLQPWRYRRDWARYLKKLISADVVIFPGFFHFPTLPFHHWLRRLSKRPTLLWSEAFIGKQKLSLTRRAVKWLLLRTCDADNFHLLCVGDNAAVDYFKTGIRNWQYWRFAFSVDPLAVLPQKVVCNGTVRLLFVGSLIPRKNPCLLLQALAEPLLADSDWSLTFVGDGPLRQQLEELCREYGFLDRVEFRGSLPRQQCSCEYATADLLVLPSCFDGWGAVVNEAMEHGLCVVCSDAVGAQTLIEDGVSGFVFSEGNKLDLADRLAWFINDRQQLLDAQRSSRDQIMNYRPQAVAKRLAVLCRSIATSTTLPDFHEGLCAKLSTTPSHLGSDE
ncbi:MAG: glycosyltransferase family 4 protein [Methylococcales bacterium]